MTEQHDKRQDAQTDTTWNEQEILGSILLRGERFAEIAEDLTREHFTSRANQLIWHAMTKLATESQPIDVITVSQWLIDRKRAQDIDGGGYLTELANECIGANPAQHVKALKDRHRRKEAKRIGAELQQSRGDAESVALAITELMALEQGSINHDHALAEGIGQAFDDMQVAAESDSDIRGISTGLRAVDKHLGGIQSSDLIIVGARPSMGKTSFALNLAAHGAKAGTFVGVVSGEQPLIQLAQRHLSSASRVPLHDIRQGRISGEHTQKLSQATPELMRMGYRVFDKPNPSLLDVVAIARAWKNQHGLGMLFVDYLQRISAPGDNRVAVVGEVSRGLKTLARELDIPVVALAQVNRGVEQRSNKRPLVSDLKDSGEIEQEADQIMLIYRDEVYHEDTQDAGVAEIIIGKNRHGQVGTVRTAWRGEIVKFENLPEGPYQ